MTVMFVVVNGIPSIGMPIAVGSGFVEEQAIVPVLPLPPIAQAAPTGGNSGALPLKTEKSTVFALIVAFGLLHFSF